MVAIAGLIVGPYFGLAGLIARDRSVWAEANRLIHEHISIPFIAMFALFSGSGNFFIIALPAYVVFVSIATLMGVMATKTARSLAHPARNQP